MSENKYITELDVSLDGAQEEMFCRMGFIINYVNLNTDQDRQDIYLWYKRGNIQPIARIQLSFSDEMELALMCAGYTRIHKDLNAGAGGNSIYLCYSRGYTEYDVPIVDLQVSTTPNDDAQKFVSGWERLSCNLNRRAGGSYLYLNVRREKPVFISDVTATVNFDLDSNMFQGGWICVDENTNRGTDGIPTFIWYRLTTKTEGVITSLQLSTNYQEEDEYRKQGYEKVETSLNQGTGGSDIFLWFKKGDDDGVKRVTIINNENGELDAFEQVGVQIIKKSLNTGNSGPPLFLCYYR